MGFVFTAFRAFFAILFNREIAVRVLNILNHQDHPEPAVAKPAATVEPPRIVPEKPKSNEGVILLATLQREARLVDFLQEDLGAYSDDQVGAAVREIHRESRAVLERLFAIRPVLSDEEGAVVEIPAGYDATRYRITGKVSGNVPVRGTLRHHGWEVTKSELPEAVGNAATTKTIAPAEVEVQ